MTNAGLHELLRRSLADLQPGSLLIGLSGGLDSSTLLHALATLPEARHRGLMAIHIDHGLHQDSSNWASRCRTFSEQIDVPFRTVRVEVADETGNGLEATARAARYAAFSTFMKNGEILALAHHRDDQTETVLLKLLRGAGPEGLRGMRPLRAFATGMLWRPLLDLPRSALLAWAQENKLVHIDDPSNLDTHHARNFLRHEVVPLLRTRWPQLDRAIGHSARWLAANADYIDTEARIALARLQGLDPATLRWAEWLQLPDALRGMTLRLWLRELGLPEPEQVHVAELERQLREAHAQRLPCIAWAGCELRRHRNMLYAMTPLRTPAADWCSAWESSMLELPADCGTLSLQCNEPIANMHKFTVRFRRGGEIFRPVDDRHSRELRDLLQAAGIPPWQRNRIPLLYAESTLLAVADLWTSVEGAAYFRAHGLQLSWREKPVIDALDDGNTIDPAAAVR